MLSENEALKKPIHYFGSCIEFYTLQFSVVMSPISAHEPLAVFPGNVHCHKTLSLVPPIAWEFLKVKGILGGCKNQRKQLEVQM
jgi:hypothetical protein